jgi:hypothetical protein
LRDSKVNYLKKEFENLDRAVKASYKAMTKAALNWKGESMQRAMVATSAMAKKALMEVFARDTPARVRGADKEEDEMEEGESAADSKMDEGVAEAVDNMQGSRRVTETVLLHEGDDDGGGQGAGQEATNDVGESNADTGGGDRGGKGAVHVSMGVTASVQEGGPGARVAIALGVKRQRGAESTSIPQGAAASPLPLNSHVLYYGDGDTMPVNAKIIKIHSGNTTPAPCYDIVLDNGSTCVAYRQQLRMLPDAVTGP